MTAPASDIHALRQMVFELVETSRSQVAQGNVDLTPIETAVRSYCTALSELSLEEGREHVADLQELSAGLEQIEVELKAARDAVQTQLAQLGTHNKANKAYVKSDGIGTKYSPPDDEDDGL